VKESPIPVMLFRDPRARGGREERILTFLRGLDRRHFRVRLPIHDAKQAVAS
jgi:hypothetical protein